MGDKAGVLIGGVLTLLWLGSVVASLQGRAELWSRAFSPIGLHVLAALLVLAILANLLRRNDARKDAGGHDEP